MIGFALLVLAATGIFGALAASCLGRSDTLPRDV